MQSIIISSKDSNNSEEFVKKFASENNISRFDITVVEKEDGNTIGIEDIRDIKKKIYLLPAQGKYKVVLVKNAQNLTIEAQNSLLKILEEPPNDTFIILSCSSSESLLSTIISRCRIVSIKSSINEQPSDNLSQPKADRPMAESFNYAPISSKLKLAQDVGKNKEEALLWIEKVVLGKREELIEQVTKNIATYPCLNDLNHLNKAYKIISTTNLNPRFVLENLFLSL